MLGNYTKPNERVYGMIFLRKPQKQFERNFRQKLFSKMHFYQGEHANKKAPLSRLPVKIQHPKPDKEGD